MAEKLTNIQKLDVQTDDSAFPGEKPSDDQRIEHTERGLKMKGFGVSLHFWQKITKAGRIKRRS